MVEAIQEELEKDEFQSLIGSLSTGNRKWGADYLYQFQSLIGSLSTMSYELEELMEEINFNPS